MVKRIIFDLDNTLIIPNYDDMKNILKEEKIDLDFCNNINKYLFEYESNHTKYDKSTLLNFLNEKCNQPLSMKLLERIIESTKDIPIQDFSESENILKYLKSKEYEIVILTNWFKDIQMEKIKKANIGIYIDCIYDGEQYLKPYKESFENAKKDNKYEECAMIGDNFLIDILEASKLGMRSFFINKNKQNYEEHINYIEINKLEDLKKYL